MKKRLFVFGLLMLGALLLAACGGTLPVPEVGSPLFIEDESGNLYQGDVVLETDAVAGGIVPIESDREDYGLVLMNSRIAPGEEDPPARYFLIPLTAEGEPIVGGVGSEVREPFSIHTIIPVAAYGWFLLLIAMAPFALLAVRFLGWEQEVANLTVIVEAMTRNQIAAHVGVGVTLSKIPIMGARFKRNNYMIKEDGRWVLNNQRLNDVVDETIRAVVARWVSRTLMDNVHTLLDDEAFLTALITRAGSKLLAITGFWAEEIRITSIKDPSVVLERRGEGHAIAEQIRALVAADVSPNRAADAIARISLAQALMVLRQGSGVQITPTVQIADLSE